MVNRLLNNEINIVLKKTEEDPLLKTSFTFHYVSINTKWMDK